MKKALLMLSLIASVSAFADSSLQCKDVNAGSDNGYIVTLSADSAQISEETIAGPKPVATLKCVSVDGKPSHPDAYYPVLRCFEPNKADAGYSFNVKAGGFAGLTTGTLSKENFAGATAIAQFDCKNSQ